MRLGNIMDNNTDLHWTHDGSALVDLILQDGFKYIMCEISEDCKQYLNEGQEILRFIICDYYDGCFIDTEGNMWQDAQAILPSGDKMTYKDYLELRYVLNKDKQHGK